MRRRRGSGVKGGLAQFVARLAEQQIGVTHQLVEVVQGAACTFDALQRLRDAANGLHRRIVHAVGALMLGVLVPAHRPCIPRLRDKMHRFCIRRANTPTAATRLPLFCRDPAF